MHSSSSPTWTFRVKAATQLQARPHRGVVTVYSQRHLLRGAMQVELPNYSFNATVMCRYENPAPGAAR